MNTVVPDTVHLVCADCNSVVRLPAQRLGESPRCPNCRLGLFEGKPVTLTSANFDKHVERTDVPLVVDFWAPWCGPCMTMAPFFDAAARKLEPLWRFGKLNTEEHPQLSLRFNIRSIPTLVLFRGGREIARQSGAMDTAALTRWLNSVIPARA